MLIPEAKAALDEAWSSVWLVKAWFAETVAEFDKVRNKASKEGRIVNLGKDFPMEGSELAKGDPGRKWKGCVVIQGNNVKDAIVAVFQDITSSASLMVAGKFTDAIASLDGHLSK
jgi:hypothetical protein